MAGVVALSAPGTVFTDVRGPDRALRVSWHHEADAVVLSLWRADTCVSSFRLDAIDVPVLVQTLVDGLADYVAAAEQPSSAAG